MMIMEDNKILKASEPAAAYPMTSYADVMYYLHTIDISKDDKEKVLERLTSILQVS